MKTDNNLLGILGIAALFSPIVARPAYAQLGLAMPPSGTQSVTCSAGPAGVFSCPANASATASPIAGTVCPYLDHGHAHINPAYSTTNVTIVNATARAQGASILTGGAGATGLSTVTQVYTGPGYIPIWISYAGVGSSATPLSDISWISGRVSTLDCYIPGVCIDTGHSASNYNTGAWSYITVPSFAPTFSAGFTVKASSSGGTSGHVASPPFTDSFAFSAATGACFFPPQYVAAPPPAALASTCPYYTGTSPYTPPTSVVCP